MAGIVTESSIAFTDFDEFISHNPQLEGALDAMIWMKNSYVYVMKGIAASKMPNKVINITDLFTDYKLTVYFIYS